MLENAYRLSSHIEPFMKTQRQKKGYDTSYAQIRLHHGTHIDFPSHVVGLSNGDRWPAWDLSGPATIEPVNPEASPDGSFLADPEEIVLFDTGGEPLTAEHVDAILETDIRLVGTDHLLIGDLDAHRRLLTDDVLIIERLVSLDEPENHRGYLYCFCSLVDGCSDGAPVNLAFQPES